MAAQLLHSAPQLRQTGQSIGQQIYINPDLSPSLPTKKGNFGMRESHGDKSMMPYMHASAVNTDLVNGRSAVGLRQPTTNNQPPTVSVTADEVSALGADAGTSASNDPINVPFR
jgi:hypothetical protein